MDKISVKWYGINALEFRHSSGSFMIDPYVSRDREKLYIPTEVDKYITSKPDFVLMTHAHWDHLPDMPHILKKTGTTLYASRTACNMMRACGVPEKQLYELSYGETLHLPGNVKVTSGKNWWCAFFAVKLSDIVDGGINPGEMLYLNVIRSGNGALGVWIPTFAGYHAPERFGEIYLEPAK